MTTGENSSVWSIQRFGKFIKKPVKKVVLILGKKFKGGSPEDEPHKEGKRVVQEMF